MKFTVGFFRKKGLPDFSSIGANCSLEVELECSAYSDPARLRSEINRAYQEIRLAVESQLSVPICDSLSDSNDAQSAQTRTSKSNNRSMRKATESQIRAIQAISKRTDIDLQPLLSKLGVNELNALTVASASTLIDQLKC
ncbi:hypothetical protein CGZ80_17545 [Rhodopirellula sp. MGV]|nr:hypothetical protein CGZ80_17545 [Rhodopirellula sp. MGV]PNY37258.1 hypothetical protein C2E31_08845 [Rhodopirellula baltica]